MDADDQGFEAEEIELARDIIEDWHKARGRRRVGGCPRRVIDDARFAAERAVIGIVEYLSGSDMGEQTPFSLALDGYRYCVFPAHDSTSIANATLIVQDIETGKEIYCPGQFADLATADDD